MYIICDMHICLQIPPDATLNLIDNAKRACNILSVVLRDFSVWSKKARRSALVKYVCLQPIPASSEISKQSSSFLAVHIALTRFHQIKQLPRPQPLQIRCTVNFRGGEFFLAKFGFVNSSVVEFLDAEISCQCGKSVYYKCLPALIQINMRHTE